MEKERKLQIIKAAVKRFDKHGPNKTTLDEIARDLRIGKATIYGYFKSKEELYFASLEWEGNLYFDDIKNIFSNLDISLKERFNNYFEFKESLPDSYKLITDTLNHIIGGKSFEKEKIFFKNILASEEELIKKELMNVPTSNGKPFIYLQSYEIVLQTWSLFLGKKINSEVQPEKEIDFKNLILHQIDI